MQNNHTPIILCILDGWGYSDDKYGNAIEIANTPFWDKALKQYPYSLLETSGEAVGLPFGQMGNSEVGHMTIGSGRIIMQSLPKINKAIENNDISENEKFKKFIESVKYNNIHIMGLISPGGVHSHQDHIEYMAKLFAESKKIDTRNNNIFIHCFLDGRDTPPKSAINYIEKLENIISPYDNIKIASIMGRFYGMDRDNRIDRTDKAFDAIVKAKGKIFPTAKEAIKYHYNNNISDEFIEASIIGNYKGAKEQDGFFMANFRSDRVRQILHRIIYNDHIKFSKFLGMTPYSKEIDKKIDILFEDDPIINTLPEVIANNNIKQLHIAETEKYAHVTFFFNGGQEKEVKGEERILIASPKVEKYDLKPEMSAFEVTQALVKEINTGKFGLFVVNFANADMVGHTGDMEATIKSIEVLDECLDDIFDAVSEISDGLMICTSDHGNAERMLDKDGSGFTAHTLNPVPFVLLGERASKYKLRNGSLSDIAVTILELMGINIPQEMTGKSLIKK